MLAFASLKRSNHTTITSTLKDVCQEWCVNEFRCDLLYSSGHPNSSSLYTLSRFFTRTPHKQVAKQRVRCHWGSGGLNCCGAVSGCIAEQVVPLCLSVFACVKLPPLPSSILSSSPRLCPSINPSTLSAPTPSWRLQSRSREGGARGMREGEACLIKPQTDSERMEEEREGRGGDGGLPGPRCRPLPPSPRHWGAFHLPSASVLIC